MQAWISPQLTPGSPPPTILAVNRPSPAKYRAAFVQRVRAARVLSGKSPADMATLLGVPKDTYHRYETRTLLPHHLIELFCDLTGTDIPRLITGLQRRSEPKGDPGSTRAVA